MDTSFFSGTPVTGDTSMFGNIAAKAPPAQGQLGQMVPSVHNTVKEPMVNAYATYPLLVKPYREGYEKCFREGDLIFVFTGQMPGPSQNRVVHAANLPLLNYFLSRNVSRHDFKSHDGHKLDPLSDHRNWKLMGVMRNDAEVSGGADGSIRSRNHDRVPTGRYRLINVDVRGATAPLNYWGGDGTSRKPHAASGDVLYLVPTRVMVRVQPLMLNLFPNAFKGSEFHQLLVQLEDAARRAAGGAGQQAALDRLNQLKDAYAPITQILPRTSRDALGHVRVPEFDPNLGLTMLAADPGDDGPAIRVGRVFQSVGAGETVTSNRSLGFLLQDPRRELMETSLKRRIHVFFRT